MTLLVLICIAYYVTMSIRSTLRTWRDLIHYIADLKFIFSLLRIMHPFLATLLLMEVDLQKWDKRG